MKARYILKTAWVRRLISWIVAQYLSLVWKTCRWQIQGAEALRPYWEAGRPIIVVFWHNRMAMAPFAWEKGRPFYMLISPHSDGQLIAATVKSFGIDTIYGSSSHGAGAQALRDLVRCLRQGASVGLTPDGPQGPCEVLKEGIFSLAYLSQHDVIALSFSTSRHRRLHSWDRFFVPLPFGKGLLVWSPPIAAPRHSQEKDAFLSQIASALRYVTTTADTFIRPS